MSFKDELTEIIESVREARRQHQKSLTDARAWWNDFKEAEVRTILREAAAAFQEAGIFALSDRKNGDTVYLDIGPPNKSPEHSLVFRFDGETAAVACESSEPVLREIYEQRALTAEKVRDKIREFARIVIQQYA